MLCKNSLLRCASRRWFSSSHSRKTIEAVANLPERIHPTYQQTRHHDLLCLKWPSPPRNVLITKKDNTPETTEALVDLAKHIHSSYPEVSIILEPAAAEEVHDRLPFPVYSDFTNGKDAGSSLPQKVDMISTLGGDGTILRASSLFAAEARVPPILAFSMGTLGFLGEWQFHEYKRAFREVYMSGASDGYGTSFPAESASSQTASPTGWSSIRGKSMGSSRGARVLLRTRLKIGVFESDGQRIKFGGEPGLSPDRLHAMNEVIIHRGRDPHLAIVDVFVGGRFLTEAVADGMIVSTPTGSTAYSLSSGGSIVHPLVSSLLLTPICPRSLSFRPLVLPANTPITLKLSERNRAKEVELSIDGSSRSQGLGVGVEVRVCGEDIRDGHGNWVGGVPSIVRGAVGGETTGDDQWVGGLNGLLKFNYPFGETPV